MESITERIRASFDRQTLLTTFGATLDAAEHGHVRLSCPVTDNLRQQQGLAHGGLVFTLGDVAAGYAALSVLSPEFEVVSAELKINFLAAGRAPHLRAEGRVIKPGRRLVVVASDVYGVDDGKETHIATLMGTMAVVAA